MSKFLKATTISVLLFATIFLLTGCEKKEEMKRDVTKRVFEVEQVSDKNIKIKLENAKQGEEQEAKLVIAEGEDISSKTQMEGATGITVYYFKAGSKHNKDAADSEYLNGEGESKTEGFPAGEYEVVVEVTDANVTGNVEISVK